MENLFKKNEINKYTVKAIILIIIVFAIFAIICLSNVYKENVKSQGFISTVGTFLKAEKNHLSRVNTYFLTYEYEVQGKSYLIKTSDSNIFIPKEGTLIEVRYNPNNPENAIIKNNINKILLLILIMAIMICVSILLKNRFVLLITLIILAFVVRYAYILTNSYERYSLLIIIIFLIFLPILGIYKIIKDIKNVKERDEKNIKTIKYNLKRYTNNDYAFIYNTKKNVYKKYVEENWGSWDENFQRELFDKFISDNYNNIYIIQINNENIGFYNGIFLENGDYEISNICIIPEYQNRGIGTQVLKNILDKYINKNIRLQYFKQNPVGKLYEKLGFENLGETEYHYQMIKLKNK